MNLVIDVGNTQIFGGVFDCENLILRFRKSSKSDFTSDEFAIFLKQLFLENNISFKNITNVSISSVVPRHNYSIKNAIIKYLGINPLFLEPGVKTKIAIKYKNPSEVGSDRIANCLGAIKLYGKRNFIIIDMGTAITFDILTEKKEYLGGLIIPGIKLQLESLFQNTAKLPATEFVQASQLKTKTTIDAIQTGVYYFNYYGLTGLVNKIKNDFFKDQNSFVIGTGGFSRVYEKEKLFDEINHDLILYGLNELIKINKNTEEL
ncbi:MAG: type III pantothenate kinase [Elusimicrobiota bacterium]